MARGPAVPAAIAVVLLHGCAGDPDANPIVDVDAVCGASSQDDRYFGAAFTRANETGREELWFAFDRLSAYSEPTLACGAEVDEAYRVSLIADWPRIPLIIRAQRKGDAASIHGVGWQRGPAMNHSAHRIDRLLSPEEWHTIATAASAIDVPGLRALLRPHPNVISSQMFLFEFRRRNSYSLLWRSASSLRRLEALDRLKYALIELAGYEYEWR